MLANDGGAPGLSVTKAHAASEGTTSARAAIDTTMKAYNVALNGGKTADVLPLYTEDGIFMAPYSQSFIGKDAVRRAYDQVFRALKFNVTFNIAEIGQMAPRWAYVRTNSAGTTVHHSSGRMESEANQELFIHPEKGGGRPMEDRALQLLAHQSTELLMTAVTSQAPRVIHALGHREARSGAEQPGTLT